MNSIKEYLTFDDILLLPKYTTIRHRETDVDISVKIKNFTFKHPIIVANMQSLISMEMLVAIIKSGGLAIDHRFQPFEQQIFRFKKCWEKYPETPNHFCISIGVDEEHLENVKTFVNAGGKIICLDVAHCHSECAIDMIKAVSKFAKDNKKEILFIAGNIATETAARSIFGFGADVGKAGIGSGALCTTRINTGCGVPSFTMLQNIYKIMPEFPDRFIIADGGVKNSGDCVKALTHSNMVMIGNLFAGSSDAEGKVFQGKDIGLDPKYTYKLYKGSSTHKTRNKEGVEAYVKTKGSYAEILDVLLQGIVSGCSYQNSHNLTQLREDVEFVKITAASLRESYPHDIDYILR